MEADVGYGWVDGIHPDDRESVLERYEAAFDARESFSLETRLLRSDGEYRWIAVAARPRVDALGEFTGYIGSCHDISDRQEAEQSLLQARDELEARVGRRTAQLERQFERQAAIAELELAAAEPHELHDVLEAIVRTVAERLPTTGGASAVLWDDRIESFTIGCSTIPEQTNGAAARVRRSGGATRWIIDHAQPLVVPNIDHDPFGANAMLEEQGLRAYVGIPLIDEGKAIGVLYALDNVERTYEREDVDFIQTLASRATLAIVRSRLYGDLKMANEQLEQRVRERTAELERANVELQREVTVRRRAEEALHVSESRFRSLFENAAEAIVVCDVATGKFVDANDNACQLFKLDREALFETGPAALSPTRQPNGQLSTKLVQQRVEDAIGGQLSVFEWIHRDSEGREFPCEVSLNRLPSKDRFLVRGMVIEITARKEAEARQRELELQLRQSQRLEAVATLAAGVAHDVNNSLTAILGYTAVARKDITNVGHVESALSGIEHASSLTAAVARSLLTFSRRTEGRRTPIDLARLCEEELQTLRTMLPAMVELQFEPHPDTGWLNGDHAQIRQVLVNLVLNARDATGGQGTIRIATRPTASETIELIVEDNGAGMSEEVMERIFDPFFSTKPREQGTGLGMAIVHSIVIDHGGEIDIRSSPGRGTCVTVSFPATVGSTGPAPTASIGPEQAGHGQLVLLAEDNEHVRSIMVQALESANFVVEAASDGQAAVERMDEIGDDVAILVLDVDMPRIDGSTCLRMIRDHYPHLPAIFVSGLKEPGVGVDDSLENCTLLQKPFRIAELVNAIATTLQHQATDRS